MSTEETSTSPAVEVEKKAEDVGQVEQTENAEVVEEQAVEEQMVESESSQSCS
jgi:hypothetical protein